MDQKEERRNICVEAISGWHDPKCGKTYSSLATECDLAESYIRKLARGSGCPSEAALQLILTVIWGFEKASAIVYNLRNGLAPQQITTPILVDRGSKATTTLKAENKLEADFLIRMAGSERMSIGFARQLLGDSFDSIIEKFAEQSDFARIEGDFIVLTCTRTETLLLQTIREFGHYFIDRADNIRENCILAARSEALSQDAIESIDSVLRSSHSKVVSIMTSPESKGDTVFGFTIAGSVLWKKDANL